MGFDATDSGRDARTDGDGHGEWRERLALELYGELEAGEAEELARHVAGCAECASFRAELRGGLGRLAGAERGSAGSGDLCRILALPPAAPRGRRRAAVAFALGLAAGLAAGWGAVLVSTSGGQPDAELANPTAEVREVDGPAFARAAPPARARAGGELAQLGAYLRR